MSGYGECCGVSCGLGCTDDVRASEYGMHTEHTRHGIAIAVYCTCTHVACVRTYVRTIVRTFTGTYVRTREDSALPASRKKLVSFFSRVL
jgi:hypothetical protein